KILTMIGVGILLIGILIQFIHYGHDHPNPTANVEPKWPNPETQVFARLACFDCHSNQTRWPWYSNIAPASWLVYRDVTEGRMHINFSDWNRTEEQHADEFQKVFDENSMPPAQYLLLHPEARLSVEDKKKLFNGLAIIAKKYMEQHGQ